MTNKQELLFAPAATDSFAEIGVQGDTVARLVIGADGKLSLGPGGASAADVVLSRLSAGVFDITTGSLALNGTTITASAAEINRLATSSGKVVNCTTSTLTVTQALHANRLITLNRAAGIAVTLPAATGTGDVYNFIVATTFTANATIAVASASDYLRGRVFILSDNSAAVLGYSTSNSGTLATESDTITLFTASSNTTGGIIGDIIQIRDIATNVFHVIAHTQSGGTEATPFSAAV